MINLKEILIYQRLGTFTAMVIWMAKDGRLKPHELDILKKELSSGVFEKDEEDLKSINQINL